MAVVLHFAYRGHPPNLNAPNAPSSAVKRLCVCGRSKAFPACDGSHEGDAWSCAPAMAEAPYVFVSGPSYSNVAAKAAAELGGALYAPGIPVSGTTLVLLTDGRDLPLLRRATLAVPHDERHVIAIGVSGPHCAASLGATTWAEIPASGPGVFTSIKAALVGQPLGSVPSRGKVFLSHATHDEPLLMPIVRQLRDGGADIFTCADSIHGGRWSEAIEVALRGADAVVIAVSDAQRGSVYCGFEAGMAMALHIPLHLVSLDGSVPPAYLQHLQCVDALRLMREKPWLDVDDVVFQIMADATNATPPIAL